MESRVNWTVENSIRAWVLKEERIRKRRETPPSVRLKTESRESKILRYLQELSERTQT